jgi:hypothetical protein
MGIRKMTAKRDGEVTGHYGKVIGAGQPAIRVVFLWLCCRR